MDGHQDPDSHDLRGQDASTPASPASSPSGADEAVEARLRRMVQPVAPSVAADHLQRMEAATPVPVAAPREKRFGRIAVAAAAIVGFLVGSTGFAMAGALPAPAQDVAHDVLSVVQIDVPKGKEGKRGPCVSQAAKIEDETEKAAAKDACPKGPFGPPDGAGDQGQDRGEGNGRDGAPGQNRTDPCKGKPPWAGQSDLTEQQRADLKAAHAAECGRGLDDEGEEPEVEELEDEDEIQGNGG